MMFKKLMFAVMPMMMVAGSAVADDNATDLTIDASMITVADANIVEFGIDVDVDQLTVDAGQDKKVDAIEACFRQCGYSNYGWGGHHSCYGSYQSCYGGYNSCYTPCYQPYYSYTSYCVARPVCYSSCVYQPAYSSYWGCY
jgi:hypothetical protein